MSSLSRTSRPSTVAALVLACGLLLAGCGDDTPAAPSETSSTASSSNSPTPTPTPTGSASPSAKESATSQAPAAGPSVDVTIKGDEVTPNGKRLKLGVGKTVTINVDSDRAGELHVHSTPEQELEYAKGRTTLKVTIGRPGIVDVEDHIGDVVVCQLEVS